ncbi:MAG: transcription elongation factor GreA [Patescibacteria group bacterium]|nr:transcription elongation factor GreA [Patescibacteria group bacterium]
MTKYLTPEGLKKIKEELDYLKNVKRKEIAERIRHAASFGDLSENAAYDEAKDSQGFLEREIYRLKTILSKAQVIKKKENGKVQIGSIVHLKSENNKKQKFQIVESEESDIIKGKISQESPIGSALLGKSKGKKIKIKTPEGKIEYEIFEVE